MRSISIIVALILGLAICTYCQDLNSTIDIELILDVKLEGGAITKGNPLGLLVQFRKKGEMTWSVLYSKVSDINSCMDMNVPGPGTVSVQVTSTNPTIVAKNTKTDFYILEIGKSKIILQSEIELNPKKSRTVRIPLILREVSAARLCVPDEFISGAVQLVRRDSELRRALIYSVSNRKLLADTWFGGIAPGIWEVLFLDNNDHIFVSQELVLSKNEIGQVECGTKQ